MKKRSFLIAAILSLITNGQLVGISSGVVFGIFSTILITPQEVYAGSHGVGDFSRGFKKYFEKDYVGALSDFNKAIEKEPNYGRYYALRALTKYALKDYASALPDADQAIYLMPNNAKFFVMRGMILERLNDVKGACIEWNFAASMNRSDAKTLLNKYCD